MQWPTDLVCTDMDSVLGPITLAATGKGLAGAWFVGQRHYPGTDDWPRDERHPVMRSAELQLRQFLAGTRRDFDLPLDLDAGTPFQRSVWRELLKIAAGNTRSYAQISAQIGRPAAARAVGAAVGRNPISIIVPCHRVVGSNGALTGYAGGLTRKASLLALESRIDPAAGSAARGTRLQAQLGRTITA